MENTKTVLLLILGITLICVALDTWISFCCKIAKDKSWGLVLTFSPFVVVPLMIAIWLDLK